MLTSDISWVREQRELVEKAIPVEKTTTSLRAEPYCDLARTAFGVLRPIDVYARFVVVDQLQHATEALRKALVQVERLKCTNRALLERSNDPIVIVGMSRAASQVG